jgi:hypothetical protein
MGSIGSARRPVWSATIGCPGVLREERPAYPSRLGSLCPKIHAVRISLKQANSALEGTKTGHGSGRPKRWARVNLRPIKQPAATPGDFLRSPCGQARSAYRSWPGPPPDDSLEDLLPRLGVAQLLAESFLAQHLGQLGEDLKILLIDLIATVRHDQRK